jgi:hypothetical protein
MQPGKSIFMPQNLIFEISGEITGLESSKYEEEIFSYLDDRHYEIGREISVEINELLHRYKNIGSITVNIAFEKGSILITGLAVIDFLGRIAGGISFFEYLARLIKRLIEKHIKRQARQQRYDVNVAVQVIPVIEPLQDSNEEISIWTRVPAPLLWAITAINIIFFVGGTLFNLFQVDSIQQKYDEADKKFQEANEKYVEANKELLATKISYYSKFTEINELADSLRAVKKLAIKSLNDDTTDLSQNIKYLSLQIETFSSRAQDLSLKVKNGEVTLDTMTKNINNLQERGVKFHFPVIWRFMGWDLRSILLLIPVLIAIVAFIRRR